MGVHLIKPPGSEGVGITPKTMMAGVGRIGVDEAWAIRLAQKIRYHGLDTTPVREEGLYEKRLRQRIDGLDELIAEVNAEINYDDDGDGVWWAVLVVEYGDGFMAAPRRRPGDTAEFLPLEAKP